MIYGVGEPGSVPHTAVVAGYDASTGHWEILDPAYESEAQPRPWTTTDLEAWWGGRYFAYPRYTMVVLEVDVPGPIEPVPERPPTPPATTDTPPTLTPAPPPIGTPTPNQTESP